MHIEIQTSGLTDSSELRHFVESRAALSLGALRDQTRLVSVHVGNADASGEERHVRCRVAIKAYTHADVVIESTDSNRYVAIHRALDEAGWVLARGLAREQRTMLQQQVAMACGANPLSKPAAGLERGRAA